MYTYLSFIENEANCNEINLFLQEFTVLKILSDVIQMIDSTL